MALKGDLREFSLINVMQIICMERRRAGLFVRRRGEEAVIYFDDGDVVYANAGHLVGEEAIYQLLTWTDGTFATSQQIGIPAKNISKNWNHLLIEGMRRLDEERKDSAPTTQDGRNLSTSETQLDRTLQDGLMVLLSNLEQSMSRLGERKLQKRPDSAQQVLSQAVNQAAEFSERLPQSRRSSLDLRSVVKRIQPECPELSKLRLDSNRFVVVQASIPASGLKGLFNNRHSNVRELCTGLMKILECYLSLFADLFLSPLMRNQWKETYSVFILDLRRNVDSIQF